MTAVLAATDALRSDRMMSLDDTQISYSSSSTDWRAKYNEVADMLAETRAELDDFHHASKELEAELENELSRTEKAQRDLKVKVDRAETEKDEWKSKFMSLQSLHNTTTTSLQRELARLRQEHQQTKIQLRDLEMGNDDLERTEREVSSSLADVEAKYSRALEEKIILEHELLEKATLEEQCQRLKDELRDAAYESTILKEQLTTQTQLAAQLSSQLSSRRNSSTETASSATPSSSKFPRLSVASEDDLLNTPPLADLQLSELDLSSESLPETTPSDEDATPRKRAPIRYGGQSALLQRAGFQPNQTITSPTSSSGIPRSNTSPSIYGSPRTPITRSPVMRNPSTMSTSSTTSTASRSKGVQMVSEMRARVKVLEQKIHTRVPRLRMGSITGRPNANALAQSTLDSPSSSSTTASHKSTMGKSSWENPLTTRRSNDSTRSKESEKSKKDSGADSSGWVLIMEDSPSPPKDRNRERRRASSPLGASQYRPAASTSSASPTLPSSRPSGLYQSTMSTGARRPQSRLSAGSTTTTSSIPTPTSRPATPTFLPVPTAGLSAMKRSTASSNLAKRSSLGSSTAAMPPPDVPRGRPTTLPPLPRHNNNSPSPNSLSDNTKALPRLPGMANVTVRNALKLPPSSSAAALSQSRIGRPSGGFTRRKSSDDGDRTLSDIRGDLRPRSGSTAAHGNKEV